jgi:N-methylhydantoinase A/oxoprolinase/acetone carboxylase beta subunit
VAAGGGSKLKFQSGVFKVGPESVSAHPGPVCYRKGGQLAVTDANLLLGRVIPDYFPFIFGPHASTPRLLTLLYALFLAVGKKARILFHVDPFQVLLKVLIQDVDLVVQSCWSFF